MDDLEQGGRLRLKFVFSLYQKNQENKHLKSNWFQARKQQLLSKQFIGRRWCSLSAHWKNPSLVPCPKHSWGPTFLTGNRPVCTGRQVGQEFSRLAWEGLLLRVSVMMWGRSPRRSSSFTNNFSRRLTPKEAFYKASRNLIDLFVCFLHVEEEAISSLITSSSLLSEQLRYIPLRTTTTTHVYVQKSLEDRDSWASIKYWR